MPLDSTHAGAHGGNQSALASIWRVKPSLNGRCTEHCHWTVRDQALSRFHLLLWRHFNIVSDLLLCINYYVSSMADIAYILLQMYYYHHIISVLPCVLFYILMNDDVHWSPWKLQQTLVIHSVCDDDDEVISWELLRTSAGLHSSVIMLIHLTALSVFRKKMFYQLKYESQSSSSQRVVHASLFRLILASCSYTHKYGGQILICVMFNYFYIWPVETAHMSFWS